MKFKRYIGIFACLLVTACIDYGPMATEEFDTGLDGRQVTGRGLFITNEGNFMYGNASLSYYNTETREVENDIFARANGMLLGDVAQSMTLNGGLGWVVVNNSGVVFAIDPRTCREAGRITGFTSPRYIHFVDDRKAYVTQLWDSRILIVDPTTFSVTGSIETGMDAKTASTEQMVQYGKHLFVNCWSNQNSILVVDTDTDTVVDRIEIGAQPSSIALDCNGKLWAITEGNADEPPALWRIDAATRAVEQVFAFGASNAPRGLQLNGSRDRLYYIDRDVWQMPVTATSLPAEPLIPHGNTLYYSLTVNPVDSEIYVADAIDYVQPGRIYRYSPEGDLLDSFTVRIIPGSFCWL